MQLSGHQYRITISPLDVSETNRVLGFMLYPFLCIHLSAPLPTLSFSPPFPCNKIPSNLFHRDLPAEASGGCFYCVSPSSPISPSKEPSQQRVKKWGFSLDEALKDPMGQELFLKFLESEFSSENLR